MSITLFDVQAGMQGTSPGCATPITAAELLDEMKRLDIARALVRVTPDTMDFDLVASNEALFAACAGHPLTPCPIMAPASGHDLPSEEAQVDAHIRNGAGAVFVRPGPDSWLLADWSCDHLFAALEARRMPVLCLERLVPLERVGELARRYPDLPLLVAEVNYRMQRTLLPLLETFHNVYLSIGNNYVVHLGIEQCVQVAGPERLLFGTGFPDSEPMAAVTHLMYAGIGEEARAAIGAGNLERLQGDIIR